MKNIKIFILIFTLGFATSCGDYLDIVPEGTATMENAFSNRQNAESFLHTCYSYLPNPANPSNAPGFICGDEFTFAYSNLSAPSAWDNALEVQEGRQLVDGPMYNFWDGANGGHNLWIGIRDCNIFLDEIDSVYDMDDEEKLRWKAEVSTLKAYYHFFLLRLYGPIPIMDDDIDVSTDVDNVRVYRDKFDDVVDYIVETIDAAMPDLFAVVDDASTQTGRITQTVAAAFKAQTLVLAASPQFVGSAMEDSGNSTYINIQDNRGEYIFPRDLTKDMKLERWMRALRAVNDAIVLAESDGARRLHTEYTGRNSLNIDAKSAGTVDDTTETIITLQSILTDGWESTEIIFATDDSPVSMQTYGAPSLQVGDYNQRAAANLFSVTMNVVEDYYTENGVPMSVDNEWLDASNNWYDGRYEAVVIDQADATLSGGGYEVLYAGTGDQYTARMHIGREPRFYANIGFDRGSWFMDQCRTVDSDVPKLLLRKGEFGNSSLAQYNLTGYNNKKVCGLEVYIYGNIESTVSTQRFAWPLIRLSDLYLLYSECANEVLYFSGASSPSSNSFPSELTQSETNEYGTVSPALTYQNATWHIDQVRARAGLESVSSAWTQHTDVNWDDFLNLREIIRTERKIELALEGQRFWDMRRWLEAPDAIKGWNTNGISVDEYYQVIEVISRDIKYSYKDYLWPISRSAILGNPNFVQNPGW